MKWTADVGLKLIALGLALGIWYYALGEESVEFKRTVPLEILMENEQMSILDISADTLQVTFKAPRSLIANIAGQEIKAVHKIDKNVSSAGEYSFRIEPGEIKVPNLQVRVQSIEPEAVRIKVDELITQRLPIKPNFVGEPAFGYKIKEEEVQMDPNAILVQGPKGEFQKTSEALTQSIDLIGRIRSFRRTVELDMPENIKPLSESIVDIYVPIREEFGEKEFINIPVRVLQRADVRGRIKLLPSEISFYLTGSSRVLNKLEAENILVHVDLSTMDYGEHIVEVKMILPEGVSVKDGKTPTIKAQITQEV